MGFQGAFHYIVTLLETRRHEADPASSSTQAIARNTWCFKIRSHRRLACDAIDRCATGEPPVATIPSFENASSRFRLFRSGFLPAMAWFVVATVAGLLRGDEKHQYEFEEISIAPASADEPLLEEWSAQRAIEYLEDGATAWTKKRNCISCHTNGSYLMLRPALTDVFGKPSEAIREFYVAKLEQHEAKDPEEIKKGITPTKLAYLAAGLAEWDAHVSGSLSRETERALALMFRAQSDDGSFSNQDCWPPYESSEYHGATVAAMAAARAPDYLASLDGATRSGYQSLVSYLKNTQPPHDYGRLLLLWTSTRIEGLVSASQKQRFIDMILGHQQADGGWSIRSFAAPESWGSGNRAKKLLSEPDYANPASDGHLTGLAIVVLRDAELSAEDPNILRGINWITRNQRESGRWWTRSLNNDKFHFITYSGTCFPLLALAKTNQLPALNSE